MTTQLIQAVVCGVREGVAVRGAEETFRFVKIKNTRGTRGAGRAFVLKGRRVGGRGQSREIIKIASRTQMRISFFNHNFYCKAMLSPSE